jgi:hypothetical protein
MDAMQALIAGLNSTSKKALILDEIYINAMLTMFLNDYNRKNIRQTTFLLRPYDQEKNFTDSMGMFTSALNYHKIRTIGNYDFVGTDLVYIDLSLMKEFTYHILCYLIYKIHHVFLSNPSLCQIVVKTNQDIGSDENQFFKNMGFKIFSEIFTENLTTREKIAIFNINNRHFRPNNVRCSNRRKKVHATY